MQLAIGENSCFIYSQNKMYGLYGMVKRDYDCHGGFPFSIFVCIFLLLRTFSWKPSVMLHVLQVVLGTRWLVWDCIPWGERMSSFSFAQWCGPCSQDPSSLFSLADLILSRETFGNIKYIYLDKILLFFLVFCDEVQSKSSLKNKNKQKTNKKTWLWKPVWKSLTWQDALQWDWSIAGKFVLLLAVKLLSEFSWWAAIILLSVAVEESFGLGSRSCHRIIAFSTVHVPCGQFAPFLVMQWSSLVSEKLFVCQHHTGKYLLERVNMSLSHDSKSLGFSFWFFRNNCMNCTKACIS